MIRHQREIELRARTGGQPAQRREITLLAPAVFAVTIPFEQAAVSPT
jgi:hypothetical protein